MKDKTTDEALQIVTPQEYSLAFNGSLVPGIDPVGVWTPPSSKRTFTVTELYDLFSKDCSINILFLGDSTDRRAADTLHILLNDRHNLSAIDNQNHFIYKWNRKYEDQTRQILDDDTANNCSGSIDNIFRQKYDQMLNFSYADHIRKNYTVIVASTGPWNNMNLTPKQARENIQKVIHHLYNQIPDDVLLLWKTASWNRYANWNPLEENQINNLQKHGSNYLVHYANEVSRETISKINSTRLRLVDWSKEICPYVWERKRAVNMGSEDGNPWHVGAKARILLIQMIAWEYSQYQNEKLGAGRTQKEQVRGQWTILERVATLEPCGGCGNGTDVYPQSTADVSTMVSTNTVKYFTPSMSMTNQEIWIGLVGLALLLLVTNRKINYKHHSERVNTLDG